MRYADLHTHTHLSFDSEANLMENCAAALRAGISTLAVTNHFDFDGILDGIYPSYLPHMDKPEIEAARAAFPSLRILHSIEMGQVHTYAKLLPRLKANHGFDYVLASLHNIPGELDFCWMRFDDMPNTLCHQLLVRYFDELERMVRTPGIDTMGHLTYPIRYMRKYGKDINLFRFEGQLRKLFHTLVENGINLEVNTSGIRQGVGETLPGFDMVALYRDCGGKKIAVGSDAHFSEHVGHHVIEITDKLAVMGMEIAYSD